MDNIKKLLGKKIKEMRLKKGISQEKLAELLDLDRRSISNIECGNTFPSSSLSKLAEIFDINIKNLFDFNAENKTKEALIKEITQKLNKLTTEELKIIYRLVEVM